MWRRPSPRARSSEATLTLSSRPGKKAATQHRGWELATSIRRWAATIPTSLVATRGNTGRIKAGGLQLGRVGTPPVARGRQQTRSSDPSTSSSGGRSTPIGSGWIAPTDQELVQAKWKWKSIREPTASVPSGSTQESQQEEKDKDPPEPRLHTSSLETIERAQRQLELRDKYRVWADTPEEAVVVK